MPMTLRQEVWGRLAGLRRQLRLRLAGEGLAALFLLLVAAVFLSLALDYGLSLERPARVGVMALAVACVGWILWKRLVRPLSARMDYDALALLAEKASPPLSDRLISAIQLGRRGPGSELNAAMVDRLVAEANAMVGQIDSRRVVEWRRGRQMLLTAAAAVGLLAGFTVWKSDLMGAWLVRNVAMSNEPWPQDVYLKVEVPGQKGPDFHVVRGQDLTVVVRAERSTPAVRLPGEIEMHVRGWDAEKVELSDPAEGTYVRTFQAVNEEFTFYVTCKGDALDKRRPHHVRVIEAPTAENVRFVLAYPAYMNQGEAAETLGGQRSGMVVSVGTAVTVYARATKDIESAVLKLRGDGPAVDVPMEFVGEDDDRRRLRGRFRLDPGAKKHPRMMVIELTDTEGATGRAADCRIVARPDAGPDLSFESYDIARKITARATIPLRMDARDDYGLAELWVEASRKGGSEAPVRTPVDIGSGLVRRYVHPSGAGDEARADPPFKLDIEPMTLDAEARPTVLVRLGASDNMPEDKPETPPTDRYGGPNRTTAPKVLAFIVVPDNEVSDLLINRQRGLRVDLLAARGVQARALAETIAAERSAAGDAGTAARRLGESAKLQQQVAASCGRVGEGFAGLLAEMLNNRLGTEAMHDSLRTKVIARLRDVSGQGLAVEGALNATSRAAPADMAAQTRRIAATQKEILAIIDEVLRTIEETASLQEAINRAMLIRKALEDVRERTRKWLEEQLGGAVEPATQPRAPDGD